MSKLIKVFVLISLFWVGVCFAGDGFFYVNILAGNPAANITTNGNSVGIDYKICDYKDNKPINCVSSQSGVGGKVGKSYGIIQKLLPNQRISASEAMFFVPHQMHPLFTQSFPILADGTTSCTSVAGKNYLTFYADATGMKIVCTP